jgi:hypothetical protein
MNMATEIKKESLQQEQQTEQVKQEAPKGVVGFSFGQSQQTKPGLQFVCGGPSIPTTQTSTLQFSRHPETGQPISRHPETGQPISRHPETGQPIPQGAFGLGMSMNNRCFPIPTHITDAQQDKKKILDSLYQELTTIRSEIDKLNKSVDTIYSIMRYL